MKTIKFPCFCLLACCFYLLPLAQTNINFSHLTVEDGLSSGSVLSIAQDTNGFIWIGTMDGLNRFDGSKVKVYKSFYTDNPLGVSIKINQLVADEKNNLWIGTNNGLYVYNSQLDSFSVYYHNDNDLNSPINNRIRALYKDKQGNIWIGTEKGLNLVRATKQSAFHFEKINLHFKNAASAIIQAVFEDDDGNIWIGTNKGLDVIAKEGHDFSAVINSFLDIGISSFAEDLNHNIWMGSNLSGVYKINKTSGSIENIKAREGDNTWLVSNIIRKIKIDKTGNVWIGTIKGLSVYNPYFNKFNSYVHKPEDYNTLNYNSIYDILKDAQDNMWVCTYFGGANIAASVTTQFKTYTNEENKNSISSNVISSIVGDSLNNLWIGTEAEGLNYFDRKKQKFYRYKNDEHDPHSITSNLVKTIIRGKDNTIWVGLHNGILERISKDYKRFEHFPIGNIESTSNSEDITSLLEDENGTIWVGRVEQGLYLFNEQKTTAKKFEEIYPNQKLSNEAITCLFEDSRRNIWIGTKQGLNVFEASENTLKTFYKRDYKNLLQSDYINCIAQDKKGIIWFGTYSGLSYFDPYKKQFKTYSVSDGLAGNKVIGIVVDDFDNLWISTDHGLTRLDKARQLFNTYNKLDGLLGDAFNYNSFYKDYQGHLFFGSYNGFVEFSPAQIQVNQFVPKLLLTRLVVNGNTIAARDASHILDKNIFATQNITLAYDQNIVTINWAVLNFIKSSKNKSVYKLAGYDKEWMPSQDLSASFTNLPPGKYTLYIKGCNNDGIWSDPAAYLTIIIRPPFWKTWWAYTFYILVFLLITFTVFNFLNSRNELKRKLQYEHAINLKQKELHQMKMDFFTHISHEIRTPLTLIVGPTEMLLEQTLSASVVKKMLNSIKTNADRLLKLTNDLLAFRKADSGYMQLKIERNNIVSFCKSIFEKFVSEALVKNIRYEFIHIDEEILVYFDAEHMEIVFSNLLSNALKFTQNGGNVSMHVQRIGNEVQIKICDNGEGIPAEDKDKIFTGFYQVKRGDDRKLGSGIGLAFAKSLVELHKGSINFMSTQDIETCFTVSLKLGKDHFDVHDTIVI